LEAALRLHAGAWSAYAAIDWLSADEKTIGGARFRQGGMGLAGGFHRHWRPWARICFFLGPRLEYWFLDQSLEGGGNSGGDPRAAGTLASLGLETALGAGFSLSAAAEPGYHWGYYSRGGLRADPALAAVLNLGFGR
jgi:hypothetical protein